MRRFSVSLLCLIFLLATNLFAQNVPENLQTRVLASFDGGEDFEWIVRSNGGKEGEVEPVWQLVPVFPRALYNRNNPAPDGAQALGVEASFIRRGYNYLEFIPTLGGEEGEGIPIPGVAKSLDVWVWGSNYNYYMEIHLKDYRGVSHVMKMGNLSFRGWQNLRASIPSVIPQVDFYDPLGSHLQISKIVLWTTPGERVGGFQVYLDELRTLTDVFATPYDGDDLADPETVNALWQRGAN